VTKATQIEKLKARVEFMENALCADGHDYVPVDKYITCIGDWDGPFLDERCIKHNRVYECRRCKRLEFIACETRPGWTQKSGEKYPGRYRTKRTYNERR